MIEINEVIRRSDQGVTHPFVCRDSEGRQIWVKGRAWSSKDLVAEWVAARLGTLWGLPLAEYDLVSVSEDLVRFSALPQISSLGSGIGFGSIHAQGAAELDYADIESISPSLRAEILLFDYWIQNSDRILGSSGGNPNLLWQSHNEQLLVIDHNSAFESDFSESHFFEQHVFHESRLHWDQPFRQEYHKKLLDILGHLPDICSSIPEDWFADDEVTGIYAHFERIRSKLLRVETESDSFWGTQG